MMIALSLNLFFAMSVVTAAEPAAPPCGGLTLQDGLVGFGERLTLDGVRTPAGEACLQAVAAELAQRAERLQSITVAARSPNDKGMREKGTAAAQHAAERLSAFGVARRMVSVVTPMARADEPDGIVITFVERRSTRAVAQLQTISGRVSVGFSVAQLRGAAPGVLMTEGDYLETGKGSVALLKLLDGTHLYVLEEATLRLGAVVIDEQGRRNVRVHLTRGEAVVLAADRPGPLYLLTGNAIAGVRGTVFRLAQEEVQKSRVETLSGTVTFGGRRANIFVAGGTGSRVDHNGSPDTPRPLLPSPTLRTPLFGTFSAGQLLRWDGLAGAVGYRVEFARDAQFTAEWRNYEAVQDRLPLPDTLGTGKWFWRVTAQDVEGFMGYPSKIYAFSTHPSSDGTR